MGLNDINKLSHTSWNYKYHIVLHPDIEEWYSIKEKRAAIGRILRNLYEWKGVNII